MAQEPPPEERGPAQTSGYYAQPAPPTNGLAIASLVLGILGLIMIPVVGSILALVFGYKARREIAESQGRQGGRGFADAGVVLGWVGIALAIVVILLAIIVAVAVFPNVEMEMPR